MHIEGSYDFESERELVWDVLMDIDVLGSIIPGLEGFGSHRREQVSEQAGGAGGPGQWQVRIEILSWSTSTSRKAYRILVEGKGPAGHVTGEGTIRLAQDGSGTVMHYAGDARIGGKIAAVGQRLLDVAAKQIAKQALRKLSKQIEARLVAG